MRKIRITKKGFLLFLVLVIGSFLLWMVDRNIYPMLLTIAKSEVRKMAQGAILEGIKEQIAMGDNLKGIMEVEKGSDGRITFVNIDPTVQAQIYTKTTAKIQHVLKTLQDRPLKISLGQALRSSLFSKYGPDFPVEILPKGSTQANIIPKLEAKGINMVMITLELKVDTEMGIIVPFTKDKMLLQTRYPIAQAFVVGEVPSYYFYNDQNGDVKKKGIEPSISVHPTPPSKE